MAAEKGCTILGNREGLGMRHNVYNNTTAFGLLSFKMQAEFRAMRDAGHKIITYDADGEWSGSNARSFILSKVYRVKEEVKV